MKRRQFILTVLLSVGLLTAPVAVSAIAGPNPNQIDKQENLNSNLLINVDGVDLESGNSLTIGHIDHDLLKPYMTKREILDIIQSNINQKSWLYGQEYEVIDFMYGASVIDKNDQLLVSHEPNGEVFFNLKEKQDFRLSGNVLVRPKKSEITILPASIVEAEYNVRFFIMDNGRRREVLNTATDLRPVAVGEAVTSDNLTYLAQTLLNRAKTSRYSYTGIDLTDYDIAFRLSSDVLRDGNSHQAQKEVFSFENNSPFEYVIKSRNQLADINSDVFSEAYILTPKGQPFSMEEEGEWTRIVYRDLKTGAELFSNSYRIKDDNQLKFRYGYDAKDSHYLLDKYQVIDGKSYVALDYYYDNKPFIASSDMREITLDVVEGSANMSYEDYAYANGYYADLQNWESKNYLPNEEYIKQVEEAKAYQNSQDENQVGLGYVSETVYSNDDISNSEAYGDNTETYSDQATTEYLISETGNSESSDEK